MGATLEQFEPSTNGAGKIGTSTNRWGEGHFAMLRVNGQAVAPLASPALTGTPTAPTASPGTNTTQIATTAFVAASEAVAKDRANHSGTQLAATISDFSTAVAATPTGTAAHTQGSDTLLADGTSDEVTAADLRAHLDDATKHRVIDDADTAADKTWSSDKIAAEIAAVAVSEVGSSLLANNAVITAKIADAAVTAAKIADATITGAKVASQTITGGKLAGGSDAPGNSKYYGTSDLGSVGFHDLPNVPTGALASLNTVGSSQIDDGAVIAAKIGSGAVTTAKIGSGAVTGVKLDGGSDTPGNSKYWGTDGSGTFGFHSHPVASLSGNLAGVLVANGYQIQAGKGANVASSSTITLGTDGNYYLITGTTAITAIATLRVGVCVMLQFAGALTLTHHATDLILPGGANITTAAGDTAIFVEYSTGDWKCIAYQRASGYALLETASVKTVLLSHTLTSGSSGGSSAATTWETRPINTKDSDPDAICTLSANQFTIPAGTYEIDAWSVGFKVDAFACRLYNVTGGAVVSGVVCGTGLSVDGAAHSERCVTTLKGRFTLATTTTLRLEQYGNNIQNTNGFGLPASISGVSEVFAQIELRKVA